MYFPNVLMTGVLGRGWMTSLFRFVLYGTSSPGWRIVDESKTETADRVARCQTAKT